MATTTRKTDSASQADNAGAETATVEQLDATAQPNPPTPPPLDVFGALQACLSTPGGQALILDIFKGWLLSEEGGAFLAECLPSARAAAPEIAGQSPAPAESVLDKGLVASLVRIPAADILSWSEYPDRIVVVTRAGQKLTIQK